MNAVFGIINLNYLPQTVFDIAKGVATSWIQGGTEPKPTPAQEASNLVKSVLDGLWEQIGDSELYYGVLNISKLFIAIGLFFIIYKVYSQMAENKISDYKAIVAAFIWPLIAVILLVEPPNLRGETITRYTNIWNISVGLRNLVNKLDSEIVTGLIGKDKADPRLVFQDLTNQYNNTITNMAGCNMGDPQLSLLCTSEMANNISNQGNEQGGLGGTLKKLADDFLSNVGNLPNQTIGAVVDLSKDPNLIFKYSTHPFAMLQRLALEPILNGILIALSVCFGLVLELSLLLVAVIAPLAVAMSFIPLQTNTIFSWLTGVVTIAMTKISFTLLTTMASYFAFDVNYGGINTSIYLLIGIAAPFIAGSVGSFSASAVYSGIGTAITYAMILTGKIPTSMFGLSKLVGK